MLVAVVDNGKLPWCYALDILIAVDEPLVTLNVQEMPLGKMRSVAVLERNFMSVIASLPRITANEVHLVEVYLASILLAGAITVRDKNSVVLHVLLYHIPWSSTQSQPLALAYGVEPVAVVLTQLASGFNLDDGSTLGAQVTTDEVVVIDLPQEANALAVLAHCIRQLHLLSDFTHTSLGHRADGKNQVLELVVGDLSKEVGLIFNRINCCSEILDAIKLASGGIMPGGGKVKILAPTSLKVSKLYHAVAHHVGVGCEPSLNRAQSIVHDVIPVLLMQRHHLERKPIAMRDEVTHLNVLLGTTIALVIIHANANVEKLQVVLCLLSQFMHHHSTIHSTRNQNGDFAHLVI